MRRRGRWFERADVVDYVIDCYAGVDGPRKRRAFVWEEGGDVLTGNSRAFCDHLARRFEMPECATRWACVHELLRSLGEVAHAYGPRVRVRGQKFKNQEPEIRVLRRGR